MPRESPSRGGSGEPHREELSMKRRPLAPSKEVARECTSKASPQKRSSEEPPPGRHFKDRLRGEGPMDETLGGSSEEEPLGETPMRATLGGSSEEEPPWEAPDGAGPQTWFRGTAARGDAPMNSCQGGAQRIVPRGEAPRSHTRKSSPARRRPPWSLRGGTSWGDTREGDPPWSLRGGAALGSPH
jgi:hypothetical protein